MVAQVKKAQRDMKHLIEENAQLFKENLCNRYVLFGPTDGSHPYETYFPADCYFHLCGIQYKNPRQRVSAKKFFQLAVDGRIDPALFSEKYSVYTRQKLGILSRLVRIDGFAAKIAPMPTVHFGRTTADLLVYNQDAIMGFRMNYQGPKAYTPCTALRDHLPKQREEKNIGFVLKTQAESRDYSIQMKPKQQMSAERASKMRVSLSLYQGSCTPPLGWKI
ncbi:hypothetical protein KIM372_02990 [Bombiscardovia nodaiensis]|uniref:Phage-Barnase-EndoU-ColicinE5/D-RelE like nuclease 4 domain-containing protein n=1 Tax=Bombiscardovia nodaiensis TaxID=2932181 RepID=A0ABM8B6U4_9BIFI|nr:hypothetical protein KIM372_02990 [Bombiscardovia nodaiensis]